MDSSQPRYDTHPLPRSVKAPSRWSTRIIPIVLLGILAFASWVETFKIWFEATTQVHISQRTADALLAIYYLLLVVMILDYCRVYITINTNPGATPTNDLHTTGGPGIPTDYKNAVNPPSPCLLLDRLRERKPKEPTDQLVIRKFRYEFTSPGAAVDPENRLSIVGNAETPSRLGYFPSRHHMDEYYTKDVFVCDPSGLPLWCNKCRIWKPDRAHHSSEMERCIRKMDHYCPWVGGMVSETSFNFFFHFTLWATIYCAFVLATSSYVMALRTNAGMPVDPAIAVAMGLSAFFGLFTATMTGGSLRFILLNLTNVEALAEKSKAYYLAIRIPNGSPPSDKYQIRTYPLAEFQQRGQEGVSDPPVEHTFAIVKTEKGENPWNCGYYSNWVSVMGKNPIGWFFPVWHSPCMGEDGTKSQYKMGPLVEDLRVRFGVAPPTMG